MQLQHETTKPASLRCHVPLYVTHRLYFKPACLACSLLPVSGHRVRIPSPSLAQSCSASAHTGTCMSVVFSSSTICSGTSTGVSIPFFNAHLKPLLLHRLDSRLGCLQPIPYYMIIDHDRSLEQNQRHPVLKMEPHGVFKEVTKQRTNKDHHQSVLPLAVVFHTCPASCLLTTCVLLLPCVSWYQPRPLFPHCDSTTAPQADRRCTPPAETATATAIETWPNPQISFLLAKTTVSFPFRIGGNLRRSCAGEVLLTTHLCAMQSMRGSSFLKCF